MIQMFKIYFNDLNKEAQKRFLEFHNIKSTEELNTNCIPIAILEYEKGEEIINDI